MAFKIILTEQALSDLQELLDYIGADDIDAAARFGRTLLNHSEILASFPYIGLMVDRRRNVRSLLHTPVRIYYQVNESRESVEILHFWHTSRRQPKIKK